jgi:hypothetical protein
MTGSPSGPTPAGPGPASLPILGWREWVVFPELGVPAIKAKVDTGARSSSLHAIHLEEVESSGSPRVRFTVLPIQDRSHPAHRVEAPLVDRRSVRSSSGESSIRPVVRLEVCLGTHRWPVEVTLARRDDMGFRMLLGRTAIRGRFLVDPGRSFLIGRPADAVSEESST